MMQTEVGEAFEPAAPGRGGSSTMPHKRNPVGCAVVLAAATKVPALVSVMLAAMVQEHERGLGNWHAEWETLPEICMLSAGALGQLTQVIEGLEIDPGRMRRNLDVTHGLILAEAVSAALAPKLGREAAHGLIEEACRRAVEQQEPARCAGERRQGRKFFPRRTGPVAGPQPTISASPNNSSTAYWQHALEEDSETKRVHRRGAEDAEEVKNRNRR